MCKNSVCCRILDYLPKLFYARIIFTASLSFFSLPSNAQTIGQVTGHIFDANTGRPISGANIVLLNSRLGTASDSTGFFILRDIPAGDYELGVRVIGYEIFKEKIALLPGRTATLSIRLTPSVLEGREISIERERSQDARLEISPATYTVAPHLVEATAGAFEDVLRAVQTLPGVITPNDFSNQFIVRGGSPNQNLILMDGIELYSPYRRNGMASVFNPAIVQDVKLYAGGFPAIFGDRLSSVLSVNSRDGATDKWLAGRIGSSITNANIVLEGKTGFGNGSWLLSGRRSFYDLFAKNFVRDLGIVNDIAFPNFRDGQAKLVLNPASKHRLQLTGFYSENIMDYLIKEEVGEQVSENQPFDGDDRMENTILGGSWTYTPSDRLQTRVYANWYRNKGRSGLGGSLSSAGIFAGRNLFTGEIITTTPPGGQPDTLNFDFNQNYNFQKISLGNWWIYQHERHTYEFGFGADVIDNSLNSGMALDEYGSLLFDALASAPNFFGALADVVDQGQSYTRSHFYFQDKISFASGKSWLQPGLRYDYYGNIDRGYFSPRMALFLTISPHTSVRFSTGLYRQSPGYEKLLDGGRIFDLLQFSELDELRAEKGVHFIAGLSQKINAEWHFTVEGYYKRLDDLIVQDFELTDQPIPTLIIVAGNGPAQPAAYRIETRQVLNRISRPINSANTNAYGVDFYFEKKAISPDDRWNGSLGFSVGKATQEQTIGQNGLALQKLSFPYEFDRRFSLNAKVRFDAGAGLRFSANWQFGTGFPYTPAIRVEPLIGFAADTSVVGGEQVVSEVPFILADPTTGYARFVPDYGPPENLNSARLADYHRLDIRISYASKISKSPFEVYVDLVNIYNRKNIFQYQPIIRIEGDNPNLPLALRFPKPVLFQRPIYMLPFVPSVGVNISF